MSNLYLKPNPTLGDIQAYVREMGKERRFDHENVLQQCLLLNEEIGELMKCVRKGHANMRIDNNKTYEFDTAGEIADILIVLTSIANQLGVDMEQAFRNKEETNKKRDWR